MSDATVVMCSMWRNDADRDLERRAAHLLSKRTDRLIWIVGDSDDDTYERLREIAAHDKRVMVAAYVSGVWGQDFDSRLRRLSMTANQWFAMLPAAAVHVIVHESDLVSPPDVVERLLAHAAVGRRCVAGWPVIRLEAQGAPREQFYDTWGYRADGVQFAAWPPYHTVYRAEEPFEVDSFGSVYMMPREHVWRGIDDWTDGAIGLCAHLRAAGERLWVDPTLRVEQPVHLWEDTTW